jgi:hypothetical protein
MMQKAKMNKRSGPKFLAVAGLSAFALMGAVETAEAQNRINVLLNGRVLSLGGVAPTQVGGRVLVPLRGVFEALGATVDYDAASKTVFATRPSATGDTQMQLRIGSTAADVNGQTRYLDVPAQVRLGRTLVPLRFVSEALGATVNWNESQRAVFITADGAGTVSPDPNPVPNYPNNPNPTNPIPTNPTIEVVTLNGVVMRIDPMRFEMRLETGTTVWIRPEIALPRGFTVQDRISVRGTYNNGEVRADQINILQQGGNDGQTFPGENPRPGGGGGGVRPGQIGRPAEFEGTVIAIVSADSVQVRNPRGRELTVQSRTRLPGRLNIGDRVNIVGTYGETGVENASVTIVDNNVPPVGGTNVDFLGIVESISIARNELGVRGDNGTLYTVRYDRPEDFQRADRVRVVGTFADGITTAVTVTRE